MGCATLPDPAQLIIGVLYSDENVLQMAVGKLQRSLGTLVLDEREMEFCWTDYYTKEMGRPLRRRFLFSNHLVERQLLYQIKELTNQIERELARKEGGRQINLDPGLLSAENVVLASTKNFTHRIYLRNGIFAEVTLLYQKGDFRTLEWTYPDYRTKKVQTILKEIRKLYLKKVQDPNGSVLREVKR